MKRSFYLTILAFLLFAGCGKKDPDFNVFNGKWRNIESSIIEEWMFVGNDTLLKGFSCSAMNNDTSKLEGLSILIIDDQYYYVARVYNQNQGNEVPFKLVEYKKNRFVFENLQHDFPQRITYNFADNDSLTVTIEAVDDENPKAINFCFTKY